MKAELGEVARKLDEKYSPQGTRVVFCDEVYRKRQDDFDKWLEENGSPRSSHAGIPDTSEMLYLGGDPGSSEGWVPTALIPTALGDPLLKPGNSSILTRSESTTASPVTRGVPRQRWAIACSI